MSATIPRKLSTLTCALFGAVLLTACSEQPASDAVAGAAESSAAHVETTQAAPPVAVCNTCGTVRSINAVSVEGTGTGIGAALGAIVGGLAGNQVGGGSGRKIATAAGAIGGALAGNTIEKNRQAQSWYEVVVAMENGSEQLITVQDASGLSMGSAVRVEGSQIYLR